MRRLSLLIACAAVFLFGVTPGLAAGGSHNNAGEESAQLAAAADWFTLQRLAPNGAIDTNAHASAFAQAAALPTVPGTWTERTNLPGAGGNDFTDPPAYIDPTSNFSNSTLTRQLARSWPPCCARAKGSSKGWNRLFRRFCISTLS